MRPRDANTALISLAAVGTVVVLGSTAVSKQRQAMIKKAVGPAPVPALNGPVKAPAVPEGTWDRTRLIQACDAAIRREVPARALSPLATTTLAVNMVTVAHEEGFPLDLLLGHVLVESDCRLLVRNVGSGALGPLQVTAIACQQVGMGYPLESGPDQLRAGIRYFRWLRRTYAECGASVAVTLQHYGMGRGTWLNFHAGGCGASPCSNPSSVWREECGCGRGYSKRALAAAYRHPELHTVNWEKL